VQESYSRRSFIAGGAKGLGAVAAIAALSGPEWAYAKHPSRLTVWKLDPHYGKCGSGQHTAGCSACKACQKHAKQKRFPTANAANNHRAHTGCNCKVVLATSISYKSYVKLFGKPGQLTHRSIDLRNNNARKTFEDGKFAAHHQHP
jgi:hypothetical protein